MAKRVLALIGAAALVLVAIVVRDAIDTDDPDEPDESADGELVVVCDTDFESQCQALEGAEVRVEDSAATSAGIVDGTHDDVDAWVTTDAWYEVTSGRADGGVGQAEVLASSPVVVAAVAARADAVAALCEGEGIWRCLGDHAEEPWTRLGGEPTWGVLRVGLPDADTAVGLSVLASAATGYFGATTFAANDFTELEGWLSRLADRAGSGDRDLLTTLVRVQGTYDAGGVTAGEAEGRPELRVFEAAPEVAASAVIVDLSDGDDLDERGPLRDAFTSRGWQAGSGEPRPLLKDEVMGALHRLWLDATG